MDRNEVRPASRLKGSMLRWAAIISATVGAGLLSYCTASGTSHSPARVPFATAPARASASAVPLEDAKPFSLTDFEPLLARPQLEKVARAIEAGERVRAVQELDAVLAATGADAGSRFRYVFLLAKLREQAGDQGGALKAYEEVMNVVSPLHGHAALNAARLSLLSGRPGDALKRLKSVPSEGALADARRLLLGNVALASHDLGLAVTTLREYLKSKDKPRDSAQTAVRLAKVLLDPKLPPELAAPQDAAAEAIAHARRAQAEALDDTALVKLAREIEAQALLLLTPELRARYAVPSVEERLVQLRGLFEARKYTDVVADATALTALLSPSERWQENGCEAEYLLGKALMARRAWARAHDAFESVAKSCTRDVELNAKAHYSAARALSRNGEHMKAAQRFAELERRHPTSSLADDSRFLGALAYLELGVEARFTELLNSLPEDYPDGDMVVEGLFRLALRRIERNQWSIAARTLERAITFIKDDAGRGADFAGRERYFRARALLVTGDAERGKTELANVAIECPLSYYMLLAYSRLLDVDPSRAEETRNALVRRAESEPFVIASRPEFASPGFVRAMELLGVGEIDFATRELDALGFVDGSAAPELLWGVALLYSRAGSAKLSHALARRVLGKSPARFPAGAWMEAWRLAYPQPYQAIVQREATRNSVEPQLIYAIMREESAFDPDAESPADAHGLMQLIVPTAKVMARPLGLPYDRAALRRPEVNIPLGVRTLAQYAAKFPENPLLGIAAYNAGPGNPKRWLVQRPSTDFDIWVDSIPFRETRRYIKRVLASRGTYGLLYSSNGDDSALRLPLVLTKP